jgi:hypothetical protein
MSNLKKEAVKAVNETNIIDLILEKQAEEFEKQEPSDKKPVISALNFFTDNGKGGYMSKKGFLKLVKPQSKSELMDFAGFLKELNAGSKLNGKPFERPDKDGRPYVYLKVPCKRGDREYKVLTAERLAEFIGLYQFDIFTCNLTLESLYQAAQG